MIIGCPDLLKSESLLSKSCGSSGLPSTRMLGKDFKEFAELLNSTGVEYMVVGGYALAAYGHPVISISGFGGRRRMLGK